MSVAAKAQRQFRARAQRLQHGFSRVASIDEAPLEIQLVGVITDRLDTPCTVELSNIGLGLLNASGSGWSRILWGAF